MNTKKALVYTVVAVVAFAIGIVVSGPLHRVMHPEGPFGGPPFMMRHHDLARMLERDLELSDAQAQKIREITGATLKQEHRYREIIRKTVESNRALVEADKFDEKKARAMIRSLNGVEEDLKVLHMKQQHDIRAVLTPAQREKFNELRKKHFPKPGPGGQGDVPQFPGPPMM